MATIPTPEECAMRILRELYINRDQRPGDCLLDNNLMALQGQGWRNDDLNAGLEYCLEKGWLTRNENIGSWKLTEEGFRVA
jgi:hypothetical protein